jgi:hypothetical protein
MTKNGKNFVLPGMTRSYNPSINWSSKARNATFSQRFICPFSVLKEELAGVKWFRVSGRLTAGKLSQWC